MPITIHHNHHQNFRHEISVTCLIAMYQIYIFNGKNRVHTVCYMHVPVLNSTEYKKVRIIKIGPKR